MSYPVRYAQVDGLNLAYQVVGDGPIDLVMVDEWATPLEGRWDVPAIASRVNRLASFARVISFDKRGIGLSDPVDVPGMAMPELWVRDVVAVVDAVGADRPGVFGAHEGGPIALLFAAHFRNAPMG
jgi:pimeloyl-ACP methyl ester carboxylesterase